MCGVEHTVSLFFSDVSKIPIVHKLISAHKTINNNLGSGIYHNLHSILKSKYQEFYNKKIGLSSGNDTGMDGYFMRMQGYLRMRKFLQSNISSAEFINIPNNNKFDIEVSNIHYKKSWEGAMYFSILFYLV